MHKQYHTDYYEGVIQLRPKKIFLMKFVESRILKANGWIAKKISVENGIDYYVSSNKLARQIGKQLKKTFKGELKESVRLYSKDRQTSKNLYRVTVCFKL